MTVEILSWLTLICLSGILILRVRCIRRKEAALKREVTQRILTEHNLREARHAADQASRAKSDFLIRMSHEIRTPLNVILGISGLLSNDQLTDEQRKRVSVMRRAAENLRILTDHVLDLSAIESGETGLHPSAFDPRNLVIGVAELVRARASEKGLNLTAQVARDVPEALQGDAQRLRQVLLDLLDNAVKFTDAGEVGVELDALEDGRFLFAVRDTGPGIAAQQFNMIFQPFEQGDTSLSREHSGAGLGLAAAQRLVRQMGGNLNVASELGKGSTFSFAVALEPAQPAARATSSLCVLLAEDSEDNRFLIEAYCQGTRYRLESACDGEAALAKFMQGNFDVVLMDVQMPVLDGYTATRRIRAWEAAHQRRPTPILALSAHATPEAFEMSRAAGCDVHLTKPIERRSLLEAMERHAGKPVPVSQPPANIADLVPRFLNNRAADLTALSEALQQADYEKIRVLGHNMKGSGSGYGFPAVTRIGKSLETAAREQSAVAVQAHIAELADFLAHIPTS